MVVTGGMTGMVSVESIAQPHVIDSSARPSHRSLTGFGSVSSGSYTDGGQAGKCCNRSGAAAPTKPADRPHEPMHRDQCCYHTRCESPETLTLHCSLCKERNTVLASVMARFGWLAQ